MSIGPAITSDPHPTLSITAFATEFKESVGMAHTPARLLELLSPDAPSPFGRDEEVRVAVRDMLRHGGYKPTGRGKPASEYLARAASEGPLASINLAVDACNAVSLHSGFPISVIDLERARAPFRIAVAAEGARYVFNASGQEIDLAGLVCLFDADGACANAVRDAHRTKTSANTRRTLSVVWGCINFEGRLREATGWYRSLLEKAGAMMEDVIVS
ncbi:MAG: phenylalanine--tRNA ligase beta subunit-related protein [Longimicrobiales bacterium]